MVEIEVLDDAGTPVEGAVVEVWEARCERRAPTEEGGEIVWLGPTRVTIASMVSDAAGRCACRFEREFAYASARHPHFGRSAARAVGHAPAGSERRIRLSLLRPVVVRGTVVDADYAVVPHAVVACVGAQAVGKFAPKEEFAADAAGRFEFEAAAGTPCSIVARRRSETSMTSDVVAGEGADVIVAFPGAFSIRGRVRDVAGRPVAGAVVELAMRERGLLINPATAHVLASMGGSMQSAQPRAESDTRGEFEVMVSRSDTYQLAAWISDGKSSRTWSKLGEVTISANARHAFMELTLGEHQPLRGTVTKPDGTPAAGVELGIFESEWEASCASVIFVGMASMVTVGPDGSFSILLPPYSKTVWISGPDLSPVDAASDAQALRLVQHAHVPPLTLTGEVLDSAGSPVTGFSLAWVRDRGRYLFIPASAVIRHNTFRLSSPVLGAEWRLFALSPDHRFALGPVEPLAAGGEHRVTLRMPQPAAASVRVFAAGQPARGLRVFVENGLGSESELDRTDAQGLTRLKGLAPGPIKVSVRRGHEQLAVRDVHLLPGPNAEIAIEVTL